MFFGGTERCPISEEQVRRAFCYTVAKRLGRPAQMYPDDCALYFAKDDGHTITMVAVYCDETKVRQFDKHSLVELSFNDFSAKNIEPLVMGLLPDDREFAIESLDYAA